MINKPIFESLTVILLVCAFAANTLAFQDMRLSGWAAGSGDQGVLRFAAFADEGQQAISMSANAEGGEAISETRAWDKNGDFLAISHAAADGYLTDTASLTYTQEGRIGTIATAAASGPDVRASASGRAE